MTARKRAPRKRLDVFDSCSLEVNLTLVHCLIVVTHKGRYGSRVASAQLGKSAGRLSTLAEVSGAPISNPIFSSEKLPISVSEIAEIISAAFGQPRVLSTTSVNSTVGVGPVEVTVSSGTNSPSVNRFSAEVLLRARRFGCPPRVISIGKTCSSRFPPVRIRPVLQQISGSVSILRGRIEPSAESTGWLFTPLGPVAVQSQRFVNRSCF